MVLQPLKSLRGVRVIIQQFHRGINTSCSYFSPLHFKLLLSSGRFNMRSLLPLTVAALVVCALGRPSPITQPRSLSADPPRLTIRPPVRASNATSLESTVWNPPSDMVNPLEQVTQTEGLKSLTLTKKQVWERTLKRRGANTTENEYWSVSSKYTPAGHSCVFDRC